MRYPRATSARTRSSSDPTLENSLGIFTMSEMWWKIETSVTEGWENTQVIYSKSLEEDHRWTLSMPWIISLPTIAEHHDHCVLCPWKLLSSQHLKRRSTWIIAALTPKWPTRCRARERKFPEKQTSSRPFTAFPSVRKSLDNHKMDTAKAVDKHHFVQLQEPRIVAFFALETTIITALKKGNEIWITIVTLK